MSARLRQVLILTRDAASSARFFGSEGLGLHVVAAGEGFAQLALTQHVAEPWLTIQQIEREADCSTGYSPVLHFDVDDMDQVVTRLLMQGGRLDGPIKYPLYGKCASIRSPDGHMVGLFEPNTDLQGEDGI